MKTSTGIAFFAAALVVAGGVCLSAEKVSAPRPVSASAADIGPVPGEAPPSPRLIRVFRLHHKEPADAFSVIQPLLSANGQITVSAKARVLTVQDDESHLRIAAEALRQFDVSPRSYRIQVSFYRASGTAEEGKPASAPAQLRGLGKRLADLLRYSNYSQIDDIVVTGEEGGSLSARMGGEFLIDFTILGDLQGRGEVRLRNFRVSRVRKDDRGGEVVSHVFGTSVNLQLDKPFILGATRDEQSRTALLIVLNAKLVGDAR